MDTIHSPKGRGSWGSYGYHQQGMRPRREPGRRRRPNRSERLATPPFWNRRSPSPRDPRHLGIGWPSHRFGPRTPLGPALPIPVDPALATPPTSRSWPNLLGPLQRLAGLQRRYPLRPRNTDRNRNPCQKWRRIDHRSISPTLGRCLALDRSMQSFGESAGCFADLGGTHRSQRSDPGWKSRREPFGRLATWNVLYIDPKSKDDSNRRNPRM